MSLRREWTPSELDALWSDPASAEVLGRGDVASIFRHLQDAGMTQRQIAGLVRLGQGEVSDILAGRRVRTARVRRRIADGLRLPPDVLHTAPLVVSQRREVVHRRHKRRDWPASALDALWSDPAAADVLGKGDVAGIYQCLQDAGMTQRQIAGLVGQDQSEVSDILVAGRRVQAAVVLRRIAAGLRLPPGVLGVDRVCVCDVGWPVAPPVPVQTTPIGPLFWTGVETKALRLALPMSVRDFGHILGMTARMVSRWEAGGAGIEPSAPTQAGLNYVLSRIAPDQRARFSRWLSQDGGPATVDGSTS